MRATPFSRPTLVAASEMLERHTQAAFDQVVLRLALDDELSAGAGNSISKKCSQVGRILVALAASEIVTITGPMTLGEAVVREAILLINPSFEAPAQTAFLRSLSRDGFAAEFDERGRNPTLRAALPRGSTLQQTTRFTSYLSSISLRPRMGTSTKQSTRILEATGRRATPSSGPFSKASSTSLPAASIRRAPRSCPMRTTDGRCWRSVLSRHRSQRVECRRQELRQRPLQNAPYRRLASRPVRRGPFDLQVAYRVGNGEDVHTPLPQNPWARVLAVRPGR